MPVDPSLLRRRADLLARTRAFFAARGVLEVEAPLLAQGLVVDAHIDPIRCSVGGEPRYLLPSPEAPLKRLLAAGSGPIYSLGRAFRDGERGRLHRPEFTMLEWYRPGWDEHELMDEVAELVTELVGTERFERRTYADVFRELIDVDPHGDDVERLAAVAAEVGVTFDDDVAPTDRDGWLEVLFSLGVEPRLDPDVGTFVHDFPASQAALATVRAGEPPVARRFELLLGGMELCNGYHELTDAQAHRARFAAANEHRAALGKDRIRPDDELIAAIERGLPACSGVALGFDRLAMLALAAHSIDQVLPLAD